MESSQSKGVKQNMRGRKFRSNVNWQGTLKGKGVKQGLWAHSVKVHGDYTCTALYLILKYCFDGPMKVVNYGHI
jgi:hypothetical protein